MNSMLEILDRGILPYGDAYIMQQELVKNRLSDAVPDCLILVEHPPVVTLGRRGGIEDLRIPLSSFQGNGIEVSETDRGGRATYHGPGQLVVYPILELKDRDIPRYVRRLEAVLIDVLQDFQLTTHLREGHPGIWVQGKKIASIGISVRDWITYHGIALNVNVDLSPFNWIVPCGCSGMALTSMEDELGHRVEMESVKKIFIRHFCKCFGYNSDEEKHHPHWLKQPIIQSENIRRVENTLKNYDLQTVCKSACCPNISDCFSRGTAAFMILGTTCTRNCQFCAVPHGRPDKLDMSEPLRLAHAVRDLGLQYVVVTSVTRDDLADGGAAHFVSCIILLRSHVPKVKIEILVPDFKGISFPLNMVCSVQPDVFNHNVETVPRLYALVRPEADFRRSLTVLAFAAKRGLTVKSGLMLGLGETNDEIHDVLRALLDNGCTHLTIGQYLAPSKNHFQMARYVSPEVFAQLEFVARDMGFENVVAGPLIRSSYRADLIFERQRRVNHFGNC